MSDYTEALLDQYRKAAYAYSQARAERVYLEHYTKAILAAAMQGACDGGVKTIAAQERQAYQSEAYLTHISGLRAAIEKEELSKARMRSAEYRIEIWRTEQADRRLERKTYAA